MAITATTNQGSFRATCLILSAAGCFLFGVAGLSGSRSPDGSSGQLPPANRSVSNDGLHGNSCTPRSVETFPPDLFTLEQKQRGAILVHVAASVWLFVGLAIVCDSYLVASLEVVCDSLQMKPDVAGATFMAAGNSALELLAAIIGVFLAHSDVGLSTIVGSSIFNNLMIVSLVGLAAYRPVTLAYWPMARDCGFYCLSVLTLVIVIHDGAVTWYESVIQLLLFAVYIVVMVFNTRIDLAISERFPQLSSGNSKRLHYEGKQQEDQKQIVPDENGRADNLAMQIWSVETPSGPNMPEAASQDKDPESPFRIPSGGMKRALWVVTLPWVAAFRVTIPDCRRPGIWRRLFLATFTLSVVWISGMIYMLVWLVCATGDAIGVPDTVMGLTLLAVGTCLPDAMGGFFVTRRGMGDMAIANGIASNVFDITACLGLPWFISTALLRPGSLVVINSAGLTYTSITLLSTMIFLLVAVFWNKMQIDRKLGFIFLAAYAAVVTFACLYETNVFGPLNPPPCPRVRL